MSTNNTQQQKLTSALQTCDGAKLSARTNFTPSACTLPANKHTAKQRSRAFVNVKKIYILKVIGTVSLK